MSNQSGDTRELHWAQVDVFAERALEGNMLAIFPDATGLTDEQMQALARETNLSETTFILPRAIEIEREEGVRVRIFTTQEELPFAGHPTLGTASWLKLHHPSWREADSVVLDLRAGKVPVRFEPTGPEESGSVVAEMTQPQPTFGGEAEAAPLADAIGLPLEQLHAALEPQVVSTGLPFLVTPIASLEGLRSVVVDFAKLGEVLQAVGAKFVYCIAQQDSGTWVARMPFYGFEDPATGSAAGCAISYLVAHDAVPANEQIQILQGAQVNRPSRILAKASFQDGTVSDVRIAGRTISVASGRFLLR